MSTLPSGLPQVDNRPLTDRERRLQQRLFSDTFSFPQTFKTWHVRSLETSDIALQMTNVIGLVNTLGLGAGQTGAISLLNTGCCVLYAGTDVPKGSLVCNGASYDRSAYLALFNVIGYTFGGSGSTFQVPNIAAPGAGLKYLIVT